MYCKNIYVKSQPLSLFQNVQKSQVLDMFLFLILLFPFDPNDKIHFLNKPSNFLSVYNDNNYLVNDKNLSSTHLKLQTNNYLHILNVLEIKYYFDLL